MPGVVKSRLRYARRFSSVDSTPIESNRFLIVPVLLVGREDSLVVGDDRRGGVVQLLPTHQRSPSLRNCLIFSDGW